MWEGLKRTLEGIRRINGGLVAGADAMNHFWRFFIVHGHAAMDPLTCPVCLYCLRGLDCTGGRRCPECGTVVPRDLDGYATMARGLGRPHWFTVAMSIFQLM